MIRRIKSSIFPKNNKKIVEDLISNISLIREEHEIIVLYGSPFAGSWKGIANATIGLFPNNSLQIPQWYSNCDLTNTEFKCVLDKIIELKFTKLIISGFAIYFYEFIEFIFQRIHVEVIYHFTFAEASREEFQRSFQKVIDFAQKGKIKKIGFVKKDLVFLVNKLYNVETYFQPLSEPKIDFKISKMNLDRSKFHIGVFGADTFNKNLHNQVINSLAIDNTIVHVLDKSIFKYLMVDDRIVEHGTNMSRNDFLMILSSMDLNLYMSYSESWGLVAKESEKLGVKCLVNNSVDYFQSIDSEVKKILHERK
jgi:glycosyltransferase involved in cell wall biosynthesis